MNTSLCTRLSIRNLRILVNILINGLLSKIRISWKDKRSSTTDNYTKAEHSLNKTTTITGRLSRKIEMQQDLLLLGALMKIVN